MSAPRSEFGATWWGGAWVDAIEGRARLDPNRLPRGRAYARHGQVGAIDLEPGTIRARVRGSRLEPYEVTIALPELTAAQWDALLDAIAAKAGHVAALLDGSLLPEVLEDGRRVGVELLPTAGELRLRCTCPDQADPCKHAAAVCYLTARTLDDDPFALLLLRGRARDEVWADLRGRRGAPAPATAVTTDGARGTGRRRTRPGVDARAAFTDAPVIGPADVWAVEPPAPPRRPGHPPPLAVPPPPEGEVTADALRALASDAATRAWHLLRGDGPLDTSALALDAEQDLARRAAPLLGTSEFGRLARTAGVPSHHLVELALAWRLGGTEGTSILTHEWDPDPDTIDDGRDAMLAVGLRNVRLRVHRNRITAGPVQLRVAPDGHWYRFEKAGNRWDLVAGPAFDPLAVADPDIDDDPDAAPGP